MKKHKKRQAGFTLIEVLVGLAVGALVLAAAFALVPKAFSGQSRNQDTVGVGTLISNVRMLRGPGGYGTSGTDLAAALDTSDGVPATLTIVSGTIYNNYGGEITVTSTGVGFTVKTEGLPKDACVAEATTLSTSTTATTVINGGTAVIGAVSSVDAAADCNSDENTILWTYAS